MGYQRLTTSVVKAATRHLPGGAARARLLEERTDFLASHCPAPGHHV